MASSWIRFGLIAAICCARLLRASEKIEALEPHMGTMFRVVVCADDAEAARGAIRAAFDRVAELDNKLSDYKPDSELNQATRNPAGKWVPVSDDLYRVLKRSQAIADSSDGAFDVTVGPLVRLWRAARKRGVAPETDDIAAALGLTGYRKLHLMDHAVRFDGAGMQLDLGAIAKGYAADEALRVLRARGFGSALVAASGDIAIGDAPPGKDGWEIGIDSLNASKAVFTRTVVLHNAAVSTSGDSEQFLLTATQRYSHILDPRTGVGLTERIAVSVIAGRAIDSDALATAASVITARRGAAAGLAFIELLGAKGIVLTKADSRFSEINPGS